MVLAETPGPKVELLADRPLLQPSSTLEVRFPRAMVSADEVGGIATESPLVITPAVPGRFVWLSRRSGVFQTTGPWPLGSKFALSLPPGLHFADGHAVPAFRDRLETPSFARLEKSVRIEGDNDQHSVTITFNSAVDLADAQGRFTFVEKSGKRVSARAELVKSRPTYYDKPESWEQQWVAAREGPKAEENDHLTEEERLQPHMLLLRPEIPLSPGTWILEMKAGLRSLDGRNEIRKGERLVVGEVVAFGLSTVSQSTFDREQREVRLRFTETLAPDLSPEMCARLVKISPEVTSLEYSVNGADLAIQGPFQLGTTYDFRVDRLCYSARGSPLTGQSRKKLTISRAGPALEALPFDEADIKSPNGKLTLRSTNLKAVVLRATLLSPRSVLAYRKTKEDESERRVLENQPPPEIRGKTLLKRIILDSEQWDRPQTTEIPWRELFFGRNEGTLLVEIQGWTESSAPEAKLTRQLCAQRSDLGVLAETTGRDVRVQVNSRQDGRPLSEVEARLLGANGEPLSRGATDKDGLATFPLTGDAYWLVCRLGRDRHFVRLDRQELFRNGRYGASAWRSQDRAQPRLRSLVFTDRPLYRPGETIHAQALVRRETLGRLEIAAGMAGRLKMSDQDGNVVVEHAGISDGHGAWAVDLPIGKNLPRGVYRLDLDLSSEEIANGDSATVQVQDFQPDDFTLSVEIPDPAKVKGSLEAVVSGQYYFGGPLLGAKLRWKARSRTYSFVPPGFHHWVVGRPVLESEEEDDGESDEEKIVEGELTMPFDSPTAVIKLPLSPLQAFSREGELTVEATDPNGHTLRAKCPIEQRPEGLRLVARFAEPAGPVPGQPIPVHLAAVWPDGQLVADPRPVHIKVSTFTTRYLREKIAGTDRIEFRRKTTEEVVTEASGSTIQPQWRELEWCVGDEITATLPPLAAGDYSVEVTTRDPAGGLIKQSLPLEVKDRPQLLERLSSEVSLQPDRASYFPGDTAHIQVVPPFTGRAEIAVQRGTHVLRRKVVQLTKEAPSFDLPLGIEDAPGMQVRLLSVRSWPEAAAAPMEPAHFAGAASLQVQSKAHPLSVEVSPTRTEWEPGQEVEVGVRVLDGLGSPVPGAQVTFYAVDEGVLALMPDHAAPEPARLADDLGSSRIDVALSLFANMQSPDEFMEVLPASADLADEALVETRRLRWNFAATAVWRPGVGTDEQGRVTFRFTAPDALTRYRLTAVVCADADRFAVRESAITIRQPLIVLPGLGQFGLVGDELMARATVRNDTGMPGKAEVELLLDGKAEPPPEDAGFRTTISLAAGESGAVAFPVKLRAEGEAHWRWRARLPTPERVYVDEVASVLQVTSPALLLHETYLGESSGGPVDFLAGVNPQFVEGSGTASVRLSNSRLIQLRAAGDYLLTYPYGCTEQTLSALVPWLLRERLRPFLPTLGETPSTASVIRDGWQKVFAAQKPEGGFGLWPESRPSLYLGAYVALICALAPAESAPPQLGMDRLHGYLSEALRTPTPENESPNLRVYACWAMAESSSANLDDEVDALRQRPKELSDESLSVLALTLAKMGRPAEEILSLLAPRAPRTDDEEIWFYEAPRRHALRLLAWIKVRPQSPEVGRLVAELLKMRRQGHWGTTQNDAWVLLALARYHEIAEPGGAAELRGALASSEGETAFSLSKNDPSFAQTISHGAGAPLTLSGRSEPAPAPLYREIEFSVRPKLARQPAQNRGYAVSRSYVRLSLDGKAEPDAPLRLGDRVLVTVRVQNTRLGHYVAIDDPLPAVLEGVNPQYQMPRRADEYLRENEADHTEMRADRIHFFCDFLAPGVHEFHYLARVRMEGRATAPAAKAEEMYRPERFGLSEPQTVSAGR